MTSEVTIREDPTTGDTVTIIDGVEVSRVAPSAERVTDRLLAAKLETRLDTLQAIIDRPATVLATNDVAAIRSAIRDLQAEVKDLARVDRLQTRKLLRLLDADT